MVMALDGIKVLDVSQVAAVPMCARHLADYGADVIHVENARLGDSWRNLQAGHGGGPAGVPSDIPYNWEAFNRNKKSLAVDLSKKAGQELIYRLVKQTDIFLTNLRLSERDKLYMDFESIKKQNSDIIYGSLTGHGMNGPDKDMPAYDTTVYFCRSGINHTLTIPGMSGPSPRAAFGDNLAGIILAFGVMTALFHKEKTGKGQEVDTSLLAAGIYQETFDMSSAMTTRIDDTSYHLEAFEGTDEERAERDRLMLEAQTALMNLGDFYKERLPNPMANAYAAKDGKVFRFNGLQGDRWWDKFCQLPGLEDLAGKPEYADMESREQHKKELYHRFKEAFLSKTIEEWKPLIADLPGAPFQNLVEVADDPQVIANQMIMPFDHPSYGEIPVMGSPVNLSETPATIREPAPEIGQHTELILMEAGFEWEEIEKLKAEAVIPE